jgi:decaprenylphospho-beta-D-erythro-pentofuranosid-2-ulose 2-reductase
MKKIVIVGATSGIAIECARIWVKKEPANLVLVVRDSERAKRLAADLLVRSPESTIEAIACNFIDPSAIRDLVRLIAKSGPINIVLIAQGAFPDQLDCVNDLLLSNDTLVINGLSPCLFAEAFANVMQAQASGNIAIIGSVAGDRGRKSNYVYGAAKGLVARYAEGMQHRFAGTGIRIYSIKPGPTATAMTAKQREKGLKCASAESVAQTIVHGIEKGQAVIYAPKKWQLIMLIVRHIPAVIFNKLNI